MVVMTAAALGLAVVVFVTTHSTSPELATETEYLVLSADQSNKAAFGGAQDGSSLRKRKLAFK